jgi:hypothetical protein
MMVPFVQQLNDGLHLFNTSRMVCVIKQIKDGLLLYNNSMMVCTCQQLKDGLRYPTAQKWSAFKQQQPCVHVTFSDYKRGSLGCLISPHICAISERGASGLRMLATTV